jgi:hypothetical protein
LWPLHPVSHSAPTYEGNGVASNNSHLSVGIEGRSLRQRRDCCERNVDFTFKSSNKGFEAVAHVRRNRQDYLLALCEGNKCKCGSKGRKPGGGRVHVFEREKKRWAHAGTIALPASLPFVDYSGMSIDNGRVAIVSQPA